MRKRTFLAALAAAAILAVGAFAIVAAMTEAEIDAHASTVRAIATRTAFSPDADFAPDSLPAPVRRYLRFTFPDGPPAYRTARIAMQGMFRRPLTEDMNPTTASQVAATRTPTYIFAATTPIATGITARVYDAFIDGEMTMKAILQSVFTVEDRRGSETLNRISLRRWLMEAPTYPMAFLPGGPVTWQAIDEKSARATLSEGDLTTSVIAWFNEDGSLDRIEAEEDGDLTTPYHGSGEYAARSDYRMVEGVRVPMGFTIARRANGKIYPFWKGRLTSVNFEK